ncbi:DUF2637 domain-containing protein [Streptomyces sp. NPDC017248]|uniref:DUF2637 domain-containing protein n=1 Tax=unclassified Streptomyces TaxID=2593676 RepID=UPI0037A7ABE5
MYDEPTGHYPEFPDYPYGYRGGGGRHRATVDAFQSPLVPPDSGWDPAEELAFMLQDAMEEQQPGVPTARNGEFPTGEEQKTPHEALVEITAELPPVRGRRHNHRRVRERRDRDAIRIASYVAAALVTVIASAVSTFGGFVSYDPLRFVAESRMQSDAGSVWPLLVFGPWLVASLSILRAALHQRRAFHSWCVLVLFTGFAMTLCVAQAPKQIIDISAAALPSFASLACFQQVVRQITLTRPPRRTLPRHRFQRADTPADPAPPPSRDGLAGGAARPGKTTAAPAAQSRLKE